MVGNLTEVKTANKPKRCKMERRKYLLKTKDEYEKE